MPFFVKFRVKTVLFTLVVIFCLMFLQIYAINNVADCGKRKLPYQSTNPHGAATDISRWPWHAAIYHKLNNVSSYACGGTIVDQNTILTAAHCLFDASQPLPADRVSVHVGRDHLNTTSGSVQVLEALELVPHPEYRKQKVAHDIAIVTLSSNIEMTDFVQPACLWAEDEAQHHIVGKQGTIVGFGKTENDPVSDYLKEANLTVVEGVKCLEDARRFVSQVLTTNMFCARGQPGVSACGADSGGGMFFEWDDTWYVRGIVPFNPSPLDGSCANPTVTVFTDVHKYLDWIIPVAEADNGIDSDFLLISGRFGMVSVELSSGNTYDYHFKYVTDSDFDCKEGRIYAIENHRVIFSVQHEGKDRKEFLRSEDVITSLALDWIGRRIYWSNYPKKSIEVASLDDPYKRTVLISGTSSIRKMLVDPKRGKLYWWDSRNTVQNLLNWSNLDGTNRETILDSRRFIEVIAVSMQTGELCYSYDGWQIDCVDAYRKKHRSIPITIDPVNGLVVTDSLFYWIKSNGEYSAIESVNMKGELQEPIHTLYRKIDEYPTITLVTGKCLNSDNPCAINNGDCSENTFCLWNPDVPGGKNCTALSNEN